MLSHPPSRAFIDTELRSAVESAARACGWDAKDPNSQPNFTLTAFQQAMKDLLETRQRPRLADCRELLKVIWFVHHVAGEEFRYVWAAPRLKK